MGNNVFAIDLLWLRVGKVGGSESFIRNLIEGMHELDADFKAYLVVSRDNYNSFKHITADKRFEILKCDIDSENVRSRVLFQNFKLSGFLKSHGITRCLEPVYAIPLLGTHSVDYYTVIHDLQAKHFPSYFSKIKLMYLDLAWKFSCKHSKRIITISKYSENDIIRFLGVDKKKLSMIYNPVICMECDPDYSQQVLEKYGLESGKYFFCITSMMPHKNIFLLLEIMSQRNDDFKLLICGVGGSQSELFLSKVSEYGLEDKIIVAPYVEDMEKYAFFQECRLFLFPSVFEGFGMPPVEAMLMDKPVITTKETSIPEVTMGEAVYVDDPHDVIEWNSKIDETLQDIFFADRVHRKLTKSTNPYSLKTAAKKYLELILEGDT